MKNSKLSPEARKLWKEITAQWDLEPDAMAILQQACEALDEVRRAQETLEKEGRVVKDRFGQPKQHPECLNLRDARAAFLKSLKQLNLEGPGPRAGPGRPSGIPEWRRLMQEERFQ